MKDEEPTLNIPNIPFIKPQNILRELTLASQSFISSPMDGKNTPPIKNSMTNEPTHKFMQDKLQKTLQILSSNEKMIILQNYTKQNATIFESRKRLHKHMKQQTPK